MPCAVYMTPAHAHVTWHNHGLMRQYVYMSRDEDRHDCYEFSGFVTCVKLNLYKYIR